MNDAAFWTGALLVLVILWLALWAVAVWLKRLLGFDE